MSEQIIELPFDVPLLPVTRLTAGDISCLYENGNLRYIRVGDEEVVRMIYPAVRNTNWETAAYEIEDELLHVNEKSFEISYTAIYKLGDIHYKARIAIAGREDNSIVFVMKGEALNTFKTKRIGLCVHHPIETCTGKEVTVTRPDRSSYTAAFPEYISPHQPFKDIQAMIWTTDQNITIQLIFEGDTFETEDQRNWTDNSYKTYSTPLGKPSPVLIREAETMEQRIQLRIAKGANSVNKITAVPIKTGEEKVRLPSIGYARAYGSKLLTEDEITLLKNIPFDHYRVELYMASLVWQDELLNAVWEAKRLNSLLELVVFFSNSFKDEVEQLMAQLAAHKEKIKSLLPLHVEHEATPVFLIQYVYPRFKRALPQVEIGYGSNAFLAELNRNQPNGTDFDFVSFSMYPQVHATDTRTIMENLESQHQIIDSVRQFTSKSIHISPITFQHPTNVSADIRLHTSFGAAWTLRCLKNFCNAGHITFYQTTGDMGVVSKSQLENRNLSPLYNVLAQLKGFTPVYIALEQTDKQIVFENACGQRLRYLTEESCCF